MKVKMQRKTNCVREWYENEASPKNPFDEITPGDTVIEKRVTLSDAEFKDFSENFLIDRPWIAESREQTLCDKNGIWHCLAVTSEKSGIAVLVAAEGYSYARYTAIVDKKDLKEERK